MNLSVKYYSVVFFYFFILLFIQFSNHTKINHCNYLFAKLGKFQRHKMKEACFIHKNDYLKFVEYFEPRDLKLGSCLFNIDPFEINQTKILIIGSKKKIGLKFTKILKQNRIKYGRIKNRYHIDILHEQVKMILDKLNFETIIDLSNNLTINSWISEKFKGKKIIRIFYHPKLSINDGCDFNGVTIITDRIYQPKFYPHMSHQSKKDDINYYIFNKFIQKKMVKYSSKINIQDNTFDFDIKSKSTNATLICKIIFNLLFSNPSKKNIDLRSHSIESATILSNLNLDNIQSYYDKKSNFNFQNIYVSHITIVSNSERILNRYKIIVSAVEKALINFYNLCSIEFICVTNISPNEYDSYFKWMSFYPNFQSHLRIISVPQHFINNISKNYSINYFPEYFLRNIGLRRARGRYLISGSSDVFMPPHFFLASVKHLFSKNFLLRTRRILIQGSDIMKLSFQEHYQRYVKNQSIDYTLLNLNKFFHGNCNLPRSPNLYACGDFQGFHKNFWFKINGYLNNHFNYNIDSVLSFHLLGLFNPIFLKNQYGEFHFAHKTVSANTPHFSFSSLCSPNNIKLGIFQTINGSVNWGFPNLHFYDTFFQ